jgi:hypothetical protein
MENFLIAGGIMEGVTRGYLPFDDTDIYKIIEGASYSLISIIETGQEEDGYHI